MSKYDEDFKKACGILNNTELDELVEVAVEAMDDAATDIGMEASQEWHAKITLESALIHIAEKVANKPQLTIPKSIADELDSDFSDIDATDIGYVLDQTGPYGSRTFNDYYFKNKNIIALYLAGKALGVDLVKVVGGEIWN